MGRTIIQPIGPLYGEAVNGTVFGRPNGSVYVPSTNTIELINTTPYIMNQTVGGNKRVKFCTSDGNAIKYGYVAQAQDIASNIRVVLATDSDLSTIVAIYNMTAGIFNQTEITNVIGNYELDSETTYYVAGVMINNGQSVATSTVIEVTVVTT